MSDWIGLFGALLGAGIGFAAVWWQHREIRWERIRTKGAELITLGDRYARERYMPPRSYRDGPSQQERLLELLEQERAIVRYLEVTGGDVFRAAEQFCVETEFLTRNDNDDGNDDLEARETRFYAARKALMTELKR